jgi:hypothetical protein
MSLANVYTIDHMIKSICSVCAAHPCHNDLGTLIQHGLNRLSAYLAEETGNNTYLNASISSATFLREALTDETGYLYNSIILENCTRLSGDQSLYSSGHGIQAWSRVAHVTKDAQWTNAYVILSS